MHTSKLIPESLNLLQQKDVVINCEQISGIFGQSRIIRDDCHQKCNAENSDNTCLLTIGGPKNYIPIMSVLFVAAILFYDVQKLLQYAFHRENGSHLAEFDTIEHINFDNRLKFNNRQQTISMAAKRFNIGTAISMADKERVETITCN